MTELVDFLNEIAENSESVQKLVAQHGELVNIDISSESYNEEFINHTQYQGDLVPVTATFTFADGYSTENGPGKPIGTMRVGTVNEFTTQLFSNDIEHNKMLWVLEHSYPSVSVDEVLKNVGSSLAELKSEIAQRYPSASDEELEEKATMAVYTTTQYAIWYHSGVVVAEGNLGDGTPVTFTLGNEMLDGYDSTKALYTYLTMDREEYENYNNRSSGSGTSALAIQKDFTKPVDNSTGDGFLYGPYTVIGQQDENGIVVSGGDMTVSFQNTNITSAQVQDADGTPLDTVRLYQEFYINVVPADRNYYSLNFTVNADEALYVEAGNRGRQYLSSTPGLQTLGSGTTPVTHAASVQDTESVDTRPQSASVTVKKSDSVTDEPLSGAGFTLKKAGTDEKVSEGTTGVDGSFTFTIQEAGDYYLEETTPPTNYIGSTEKYSFTVTEDFRVVNQDGSASTEIDVPNTKRAASFNLAIKKQSEDGTALPGAVIGIYSEKGKEASKIEQVTTGVNGQAVFTTPIEIGSTIYVHEISSPAGYVLDDGWYALSSKYDTANSASPTITSDLTMDSNNGGSVTLLFTNQQETGSLTVTKAVAGNAGEKGKDFHFTITLNDTSIEGVYGDMTFTDGVASFTLMDGESKTATGLPAGTGYTVAEQEANQDGYVTTDSNTAGSIVANNTASVTFTNTKETGGVSVSKTIQGNAAEANRDFQFTMTLDQNLNGAYGDLTFTDGVAHFTLKGNETKAATNLPVGVAYTVVEVDANANGYTTTSVNETGTTAAGVIGQVSFINEKSVGSLTVTNTVTGNAGEKGRDFHFTVTLSNKAITGTYGDVQFTNGVAAFTLKDGESKHIANLPVDITYEVVETDADQNGYTTTSSGATGTIEADSPKTAAFTNSKSTGDIAVSKTVKGNAGESDREFHFTLTLNATGLNGQYGDMVFTNGIAQFTLKSGETKSASGLPVGIGYTVAETEANTEGYTTTSVGATGTTAEGETRTAAFTNTRRNGNISVTKAVKGNGGEADRNFNFTLTLDDNNINGTYGDMDFTNGVTQFTLKSGETKTAFSLPVGCSYEVVEAEANTDYYTTTSQNTTGTVEEGQTKQVSFTNTRYTGNLTISKEISGNGSNPEDIFHFEIELSDNLSGAYGDVTFTDGKAEVALKGGESVTAEGIPAGIKYTVTEKEANQNGYATTATGNAGSIKAETTETAAFTNTKLVGALTVAKKVIGNAGNTDKEFHFTVTLNDTNINGTFGDMEFENGVANFTLKHDQSKVASGLPNGISYTVTEQEANQDGYTTTMSGESGTISANTPAAAEFVNAKYSGAFSVTKQVNGQESDQEFGFTATLSDSSVNGQYGDLTFTDGVAQFTLKHGETKTVSGLPVGITYTVTENEVAGYTSEGKNSTGEIHAEETEEVLFVNIPVTHPITLYKQDAKTKEGLPGATLAVYQGTPEDLILVFRGETDENGALTGTVPGAATYYIREEAAPSGYDLDSTLHSFTVDDEGNITGTTVLYNTRSTKQVTLTKTNSVSGEPVPGAKVAVFTEGTEDPVAQGTTNEDGTLTITVEVGKTYTFRETERLEGFLLNDSEYSFTVDNSGQVTGTVSFTNTPFEVTATINKQDAETGKSLPGAEIGIYKDDRNTPIFSDTTDEDGLLSIPITAPGTYYFHELAAPEGYQLNEEWYSFTVSEKGVVSGNMVLRNTPNPEEEKPEPIQVVITKTQAGTDKAVAGATIEVYAADKQTKVYTGTTSAQGTIEVTIQEPGTYYYRESAAPIGYELDDSWHSFEVGEDMAVSGQIAFSNTRKNVTIYKVDSETKNGLGGATIQVLDGDQTTVIASGQTSDNGSFTFEMPLAAGTYYYRETAAPHGYRLDTTLHSFKVQNDGTVEGDLTLENERLDESTTVTLYKVDRRTGDGLRGAGIRVYDSDNKLVASGYTDRHGEFTFDLPEAGTYTFKERVAPNGYYLNREEFSFTVEEDGTVHGDTTICDRRKPHAHYDSDDDHDFFDERITIQKVDATNRTGLEGAKIVVLERNKRTVVDSGYTDESGKFRFTVDEPGVYYYYEEKAPDGYETDSTRHRIEVDEDGYVTGNTVLKNYSHNPSTGASAGGAGYLAGFLICSIAATACTIGIKFLKRKEENNHE